ncbi:hypothetical protein PoB_007167700 [Plakobranchus ocellatus]|uniref:Secreted protein n=1 Tax=Plakobranchus ocellatus TaxID=259542 RepID=A0AAV4DM37_9GAST|nr:hypothetical protein PoB_007167700 [Plakobranchus ocellatus]
MHSNRYAIRASNVVVWFGLSFLLPIQNKLISVFQARSGQSADGQVCTRDRGVRADFGADSLSTVPPAPLNVKGLRIACFLKI